MQTHLWPAIVTLSALLLCVVLGMNVGRARHKSGIEAPAVTGDATLERAFRVHYNTLEWAPVFLGSLWLFALYWNDRVAAGVGAVWILGRILYARGYMADPAKRGLGFGVQALATLVLLLGAIGRVVWLLATGNA